MEQDDPSLTVREVKGKPILRLVIDRLGRSSWQSKIFSAGITLRNWAKLDYNKGISWFMEYTLMPLIWSGG